MPLKIHGRQYDLVLLGASGYTGRMAVERIASTFPTNLRWAIAGRSQAKLKAIVDQSLEANPDRHPPEIEILDTSDNDRLVELVKNSFTLITAVGPYCLYGEPVIRACAQAGTHYIDVTGETAWVYRMIKKYDETAKESGAIILPQSGFDSAPADLCTWILAKCIREQLGVQTRDVTHCLYNIRASLSGGTLSSMFALFDQFSLKDLVEAEKPFAFSPIPHPAEPKRPAKSLLQRLFGSHFLPGLGTVTTSVFGRVDQVQIERSWGLLSVIPSRKHEFYGPNFRWAEVRKVRNWLHGSLIHLISVLVISLLLFIKPLRTLAKAYATEPGTGASKEERETHEIELRGIANPDFDEFSKKQAFCCVRFDNSPYYLTAILASMAALTLLEDEHELPGGFLTPCCLGQPYVDRLGDAGFQVDVRIQDK